MLLAGAIISLSSSLGYLLPAIIGLESMGIPSPGETALVAAAVLASQGQLRIWLVLLIGISSAIIGDNVGYWLGRRFGREVLVSRGPMRRRRVMLVGIGERYFARHGPKTVFLARWIALIRFAAAWLAGINRMRVRDFMLWNALGGITWGLTFGLAGYFGGKAAAGVLARAGAVGAGILLAVVVGGLLVLRARERREARRLEAEPRAGQPAEPSAESSSSEQELMQ